MTKTNSELLQKGIERVRELEAAIRKHRDALVEVTKSPTTHKVKGLEEKFPSRPITWFLHKQFKALSKP